MWNLYRHPGAIPGFSMPNKLEIIMTYTPEDINNFYTEELQKGCIVTGKRCEITAIANILVLPLSTEENDALDEYFKDDEDYKESCRLYKNIQDFPYENLPSLSNQLELMGLRGDMISAQLKLIIKVTRYLMERRLEQVSQTSPTNIS